MKNVIDVELKDWELRKLIRGHTYTGKRKGIIVHKITLNTKDPIELAQDLDTLHTEIHNSDSGCAFNFIISSTGKIIEIRGLDKTAAAIKKYNKNYYHVGLQGYNYKVIESFNLLENGIKDKRKLTEEYAVVGHNEKCPGKMMAKAMGIEDVVVEPKVEPLESTESPLGAVLSAPKVYSSTGHYKTTNPTLHNGSRGEAVKELQRLLAEYFANNENHKDLAEKDLAEKAPDPQFQIGPDGYFGLRTQSAVIQYQKENNLQPDGTVGKETWAHILPEIKEGSTGYFVKKAQVEFDIPATGIYDAELQMEISNWQIINDLPITGKIDEQTYLYLLS